MIISDLEHLEIAFQQTENETPRKVRGGFTVVSSQAEANSQGGNLATVSTRTFTGSFTYQIFALLL